MFNRFINNQLKVSDMKNNAYKKIRQKIASHSKIGINVIGKIYNAEDYKIVYGICFF